MAREIEIGVPLRIARGIGVVRDQGMGRADRVGGAHLAKRGVIAAAVPIRQRAGWLVEVVSEFKGRIVPEIVRWHVGATGSQQIEKQQSQAEVMDFCLQCLRRIETFLRRASGWRLGRRLG